MIPLVLTLSYLNKKSVQEYSDIYCKDDKKTLKMTIRSDSGVRPAKAHLVRVDWDNIMLKMQYSGTL